MRIVKDLQVICNFFIVELVKSQQFCLTNNRFDISYLCNMSGKCVTQYTNKLILIGGI